MAAKLHHFSGEVRSSEKFSAVRTQDPAFWTHIWGALKTLMIHAMGPPTSACRTIAPENWTGDDILLASIVLQSSLCQACQYQYGTVQYGHIWHQGVCNIVPGGTKPVAQKTDDENIDIDSFIDIKEHHWRLASTGATFFPTPGHPVSPPPLSNTVRQVHFCDPVASVVFICVTEYYCSIRDGYKGGHGTERTSKTPCVPFRLDGCPKHRTGFCCELAADTNT